MLHVVEKKKQSDSKGNHQSMARFWVAHEVHQTSVYMFEIEIKARPVNESSDQKLIYDAEQIKQALAFS